MNIAANLKTLAQQFEELATMAWASDFNASTLAKLEEEKEEQELAEAIDLELAARFDC